MEKNILGQIIDALDILKDYPGIEQSINLEEANEFLSTLKDLTISIIPEANDEIIEKVHSSFNTTFSDWQNTLLDLPILLFVDDPSDNFYQGLVFDGCFAKDLAEKECNGDLSCNFNFYFNNKAEITIPGEEDRKGTWEEIFLILLEHCKKNLEYPEIPETN